MASAINSKNHHLRGLFWLLLAVICIVFSSASKKLIQQKTDPAAYYSTSTLDKKIKDGSRERREYLTNITQFVDLQSADLVNFALLFTVVLSLVLYSRGKAPSKFQSERSGSLQLPGLFLRHHRLQV